MLDLLRRFWEWINEPSLYEVWEKAFDSLQAERRLRDQSSEYWRIWNEEVCPAYRNLSEATPEVLRHSETSKILSDMGKPVSQRKYY